MALTNNALPSIVPGRAVPIDVNLLFAQNQTFTATGPLNNGGSTVQLDILPGRFSGLWVVDLAVLKVSAGNETYQLALLGSNDPAFGAGNVDLLAFHDWAAAASGLVVPSLRAISPVVPTPNESVRRHTIPFSNLIGGYLLRYLQAYLTVGGTSPSVKLTSWVTYNTEDK